MIRMLAKQDGAISRDLIGNPAAACHDSVLSSQKRLTGPWERVKLDLVARQER
jgi:hypothetical protein